MVPSGEAGPGLAAGPQDHAGRLHDRYHRHALFQAQGLGAFSGDDGAHRRSSRKPDAYIRVDGAEDDLGHCAGELIARG